MKVRKEEKGFVALISVIIICAILLLVATNLSLTGFHGRFAILDSELKEKSAHFAESCIDIALIKLITIPTYNPSQETIFIEDGSCIIRNLLKNGNIGEFEIQSQYKNYFTNLVVKAEIDTGTIVSWEEFPHF